MAANSKTGRGGARPRAGRPKTKSALPGGSAFADRVLKRIKELKLQDIKDAEDYALSLLKAQDVRVQKETFLALLYWAHGKPAQQVEHSGKVNGAVTVVFQAAVPQWLKPKSK